MDLASRWGMRPDKPLRARLQLGAIPRSCREIMKRPVHCVRDDVSVQHAARLMRDRELGFVPVCDADDVVIGVLTDRDVVTRLCTTGERSCDTPVEGVMTHDVIACRATDRISRAVALMRRHRLTRILVTDTLGRAVGVISLSDVAQYERPWKTGRTLQAVAERKYAPERP